MILHPHVLSSQAVLGLQRLEFILSQPDVLVAAPADAEVDQDDAGPRKTNLIIITGVGKHTLAHRTFVLRSTVL